MNSTRRPPPGKRTKKPTPPEPPPVATILTAWILAARSLIDRLLSDLHDMRAEAAAAGSPLSDLMREWDCCQLQSGLQEADGGLVSLFMNSVSPDPLPMSSPVAAAKAIRTRKAVKR